MNDLRVAIRHLSRTPAFTIVAVLTTALGIGANTAIFGALRQVVLKPLPYPDSNRLVTINVRTPAPPMSPELFEVLDVWPSVGRVFDSSEFAPRANHVVILTHALWQERFGGRPDITGEEVILDGQRMTVRGVMPPGFQVPHKLTTYWTPLVLTPDELAEPDSPLLSVVGRLAGGASVSALSARLQSLSRALPESNGATLSNPVSLTATAMLTEQLGDSRRILWMLFAAVSCVKERHRQQQVHLLRKRAARLGLQVVEPLGA